MAPDKTKVKPAPVSTKTRHTGKGSGESQADDVPKGFIAKLCKFKILYKRHRAYWEYWDEYVWNPGPFKNRNMNNIFVAALSSILSLVYVGGAMALFFTRRLRIVQDETLYRSPAKMNFDLYYSHYLNILNCFALAVGTLFFKNTLLKALLLLWLVGRAILWVNSVRNFRLFLLRPHAYVVYNPVNPEWKWEFISSEISYWVTVFYWALNTITWTYEWIVVIVYYYFVSLRSPITCTVVPASMHRINDSALTEPCNPNRDYVLLCPKPANWKNPNAGKTTKDGGQSGQNQDLMQDNRFNRVP